MAATDGKIIIRDGKEYFVMPDGYECGMGLNIPSDPKVAYTVGKSFAQATPLWNEAKIKKVLASKERQRARDQFPPEQIKDQNGRGACVGYATAKGEEEIQIRSGKPYKELSGDGVYAAINGGVDRGSMLHDAMDFLLKSGVPFAADVPKHEYRKSRIDSSAYEKGRVNKGRECYVITTEQEMLTAVCMNMPVVVAVQASGGFSSLDQYGVSKAGNGPGNHCTLVDDAEYNTQLGSFLFDMVNSWRTSFGEQGRCKLIWKKHFVQSVKYARFFAIPATTEE